VFDTISLQQKSEVLTSAILYIPPVPDKHERNTGGMLFGLPIRFTHNV